MESAMKDKMTILVASCDKYADLLEPFAELWAKYWPDCPFETVLVTETVPETAYCFDRVVACGKGGNWCERLVRALETISTPYIMMLCDDYFLASKVDTPQILRRLDQALRYDAANLRLIPNPVPGPKNSMPAEDGLLEYRKNTAYCIATQAGIWNREFLKGLAIGKASIWEFERYGSFDLNGETRRLLVTAEKEFPFIDAVHKGHWERFAVKCLSDNGINYDFTKRGLPPLKTRVIEDFKALVFALIPNDLIVRVQNRFALGKKECA